MPKLRKIHVRGAFLLLLALTAGACFSMEESEMVLQRGTDGKSLRFDTPASREQPAVLSSSTDTASALRVAGLWLVLIGGVGGALAYLRKRQKFGGAAGAATARMTLIERLPLGANRELLLVKACDRLLVISSLANQMSLLSDLPSEESVSQPFSVVLKNHEERAESTTRELREAPSARVQLQAQLNAQIPQQIQAAMQRREPRKGAAAEQTVPAMPAWPDMETT